MYRQSAERVETEEPEDVEVARSRSASDNNSIVEEEGEFLSAATASESLSISAGNDSPGSSQRTPMLEATEVTTNRNENAGDVTSEESPETALTSEAAPASTTARNASSSRRRTVRGFTLRDLEEEREIIQRRTGGCVLLSSFILLRLWIQAVMTGDFGLLLLCLVFTSWTARFVRYTREREEELNRMINEWDETSDEEPSLNDARLHRMSFQSQLALAMMQSQIQMMEGGYGHPDGGENRPGVGDDAKGQWDRFEQKDDATCSQEGKHLCDEGPTCSICLCEYEKGEKLVQLPCKHIFHEDCITSWTDNNTRCPLCNTDLESMSGNEVV